MDLPSPVRTGYLGSHARQAPHKPAVINGTSGQVLSYRELDARSNQLVHALRALGLQRGDHIATVLENHIRCFEIAWAALRSGLILTAVNRYMTPSEVAYVVEDSGARALICSHAMHELARGLNDIMPNCSHRLMLDGVIPGWASYEDAVHGQSAEPSAEEWRGDLMLYSSGTTGRPKGIVKATAGGKVSDGAEPSRTAHLGLHHFAPDMVYLSTAPLYHAAPLTSSLYVHFYGGTVVYMEKFDPVESLALIARHRITHSQWVPTMFVRLLKLPEDTRIAFDLSSHRVAIHAAAPCPREVKHRMLDWWGPIIQEYYGASEGNGLTFIGSADWLAHPGSVGRACVGTLHICDDDGRELPPGETGLIYFERGDKAPFHYHNDPEKTLESQHLHHPHWTAAGDMGHVDQEGYLYLTDRKSFMIISGGVNIYPQAIEDALALHPKVADVAVIGVPSEEMGEDVKAIVEAAPGIDPSDALAEELIAFLHDRVARYMVPRSVDFIDKIPRLATGKLYKQALRARYPAEAGGAVLSN